MEKGKIKISGGGITITSANGAVMSLEEAIDKYPESQGIGSEAKKSFSGESHPRRLRGNRRIRHRDPLYDEKEARKRRPVTVIKGKVRIKAGVSERKIMAFLSGTTGGYAANYIATCLGLPLTTAIRNLKKLASNGKVIVTISGNRNTKFYELGSLIGTKKGIQVEKDNIALSGTIQDVPERKVSDIDAIMLHTKLELSQTAWAYESDATKNAYRDLAKALFMLLPKTTHQNMIINCIKRLKG